MFGEGVKLARGAAAIPAVATTFERCTRNNRKPCDPSIPPEEFLGPSGPKLETELKMSFQGLPALGSKKS